MTELFFLVIFPISEFNRYSEAVMKILIIGPLGAGKSSLAYAINKRFNLPRLNIDEVCRNTEDGSYYSVGEQFSRLKLFLSENDDWVAEGCQKYIYETMRPDLIIDMRICRPVAIWRFTVRFLKAKKLIGRKIDKELPVQAYHYRKISLKKIRDYDNCNREINAEISVFLKNAKIPVIKCKNFRQYGKVFAYIENFRPVRPI